MGVLARAEVLLQAKNYSGSGDWQDESGNAHHAQLGSTAGADTNDPLFLSWTGTQYLYLPGIAGNYASTPDASQHDITGDLELIGRVALTDWTPASDIVIVSKLHTSGQYSYDFRINNTNGKLALVYSLDGTALISSFSTVAPTVSDGDILWVRVTRAAASGDINFYTSTEATNDPDAVTWTQLGTTVSGSSGNLNAGTDAVEIGDRGGGGGAQALTGNLYRVVTKDGIGGTVALDADFTDAAALTEPFATFTEKSSNAATVTINRAASGRVSTVVDRAMFLLGTDDYFEIPDAAGLDFALADDFTVMAVSRAYFNQTGTLIAKKANLNSPGDIGYMLYRSTDDSNFFISDSIAESFDSFNAAHTNGQVLISAGVRNTTDDDLESFADGTGSGTPATDNSTATLANALALRVGRRAGTGTSYLDAELMAVVLWREALSDADVAGAGDELTAVDVASMMLLRVGR